MIEKSDLTEKLGSVYKDISNIEITADDSFNSLMKKFYAVMTKYGICQGTWSENGRICNNPEWCICYSSFERWVNLKFNILSLMNEPPKHLLAYGKEPKRGKPVKTKKNKK